MTGSSVLIVLASLALLVAAPSVLSSTQLSSLTEIIYLSLFAISFNILFGYTGMLSFGHSATFGIGAYSFGVVLTFAPGLGTPLAALAAIVVTGWCGLLIGASCVRLRGGYFALLTLAFAQFFYVAALVWKPVTRGDDGLPVPDVPIRLGDSIALSLSGTETSYWLTLVVTALACCAGYWLISTPFGSSAILVRENEKRAEFIGYNPYLIKLAIFVFASLLAGVAGVLFAVAQHLVSPEVFSVATSGDVLIMALLGGTRSFFAPVVGVVFYKIMQAELSQVTSHWQLFVGLLLVFMVLFAPGGIYGLAARVARLYGR